MFAVNELEPIYLAFSTWDDQPGLWYSEAFWGVSFTQRPFARIDSISGCDDSNNANGQFTANCQPDSAILTLTGSNFQLLTYFLDLNMFDRTTLNIGGQSWGNGALEWSLVNDSMITIPLASSYHRLLGAGPLLGRADQPDAQHPRVVPPTRCRSASSHPSRHRRSANLPALTLVPRSRTASCRATAHSRWAAAGPAAVSLLSPATSSMRL